MNERTWEVNAAEFAQLSKGEGWAFATLIACSVEKAKPGSQDPRNHDDLKVSASKFAKVAHTSADRVLRYLKAWEAWADEGVVIHADKLEPYMVTELEIPDRPWRKADGGFYSAPAASPPEVKPQALPVEPDPPAVQDEPKGWLDRATDELRPQFASLGWTLPDKVHVSIGFPKGKDRWGEAWTAAASSDGIAKVFISPVREKSVDVLETLTHELCHVAVGHGEKHGGDFIKAAKAMGLLPPWTATSASESFERKAEDIVTSIGEYPHGGLKVPEKPARAPKLVELVPDEPTERAEITVGIPTYLTQCPDCGYQARATRYWLDIGSPLCPTDRTELVEKS